MSSVTLSGLTFVAVRPSDEAAIRDWYGLCRAVALADRPHDPPPCPQYEFGRIRHPWPGEEEQVWVVYQGDPDGGREAGPNRGAAVAGGTLQLPMLDNLQNATCDVLVAPGHRRSGIGRAVLAHLSAEALRHGRTRLIGEVDQPLDPALPDPAGGFALAAGAELGLLETRRRLDIGTVDPDALARLDEQAKAKSRGYSLLQWVGETPRSRLDEMAYLTGRMATDAPFDDLRWGPEAYDSDRIRGRDATSLARGLHVVTTGAVDGRGRMVAFTQIVGYATSPWYADQWDTLVAPEHRGRRLGTLIKLANLSYAQEQRPQLRVIDTWNADSNPYMVGINEAMGFRRFSRAGEWQLDL